MIIGIGSTIPEITNLPGQRDEGVSLTISYPSSAFCTSASDPSPTVSGNVGAGTFSSTTGLVFVNNSTGVVDIGNTVTGTYTITYTDTNSAVATTPLEVVLSDNATFSYSASNFPQDGSNPTPTTVLAGGTFTSGSGLVFVDTTTGEINLSASTIGSYTITYNTSPVGNLCPSTSTRPIAIASGVSQIDNVYSMEFGGINDKINLPPTQISTGDLSISFWLKSSDLTSGYNNITGSNSINGYNNIFTYLSLRSGKISTAAPAGTFPNSSFLTNVVADGNWNHICLSFVKLAGPHNPQTGVIKSYVNGQLQYSLNLPTNMSFLNNTITTIGDYRASGLSPTRAFLGSLDEIGLWNVALTETEALNIYNATEVIGGVNKTADLNTLTTPPLKWYRMGD
jgi:hypothetical protein